MVFLVSSSDPALGPWYVSLHGLLELPPYYNDNVINHLWPLAERLIAWTNGRSLK